MIDSTIRPRMPPSTAYFPRPPRHKPPQTQWGCVGFLARCLFAVLHFSYHLLILLILLVGLALFWLPIISEYKGAIEAEISDYLGSPVTIGKIIIKKENNTARWTFQDIQLHDQQGVKTLMRLHELNFSLDPIESLRTTRFQPEKVTAKGGHLTIIQAPNGDVRVDGLKLPPPGFNSGAGRNSGLILDLQAINLHWINQKTNKALHFKNNHLHAVITPLEIIADMTLNPPKTVAKPIKLTTHLFYQGDEKQQKALTTDKLLWDGEFSIKAAIRDLSALPINLAENTGLQNAKIKVDAEGIIQQGTLNRLTGDLLLADALWLNAKTVDEPLAIKGKWAIEEQGWSLETILHTDQSPKHNRADKISLALKQTTKKTQKHYAVEIDQINLNRYLPLLEKQQWLGKDIKNYLTKAKPRGQLEAIDFTISLPSTFFNKKANHLTRKTLDFSDITFSGKGSLHQLSVNRHDYHPPVKQLDLEFEINDKKGQLNFNLQDSAIDYPSWFNKPIPLERLRGQISIYKEKTNLKKWQINITDLYLRNPDWQITGAGEISAPEKKPMFADLRLDFHSRRVIKNISDYVPKLMPSTGKEWLNNALLAVNIPRGTMIIKGHLNDLPFDAIKPKSKKSNKKSKNKSKQQGLFEVNFEIDQTQMKPLDEWASIHDLQGHIAFTNGAMQAQVTSGKLMKTRLTGGQISIPTFREGSRIDLKDLTVVGQLKHMVAVIKASPLGKSTADFFESTTLAGKGKAAINVQAAFNREQRHKEGIKTAVYLHPQDARLHFKAAKQTFENINGQIHFHDKGIEAEKLDLTYRGQAATLSAKTSDNKRYLDLELKQRNQLSALLTTQPKLHDLLVPFIQGEMAYQAKIRLPSYSEEAQKAERAIYIELTSTLENTVSHLPQPFNKKKEQPQPILITIYQPFDRKKTARYTVDYLPMFSLIYEDQPLRAAIALNQTSIKLPQAGITVSGKLNHMNVLPWLAAYQKIESVLANDRDETSAMPLSIDLAIKKLAFGDYQQGGSHFVLDMQSKQQGRFALISDESELVAEIAPNRWHIQGDYINFDAIKAVKEKQTQTPTPNNKKNNRQRHQQESKRQSVTFLKNLPNLVFNCQYCFVKGVLLHDLTLKTQRQPHGLMIEKIAAHNQDFSLQAQGQWHAAHTKTQLWLNDLTIQQPQNFLQSLGSEIGIVNGETKLTGQLSWQDTPLAPTLKALEGQLLMTVAAGRFTGADAGLAKILGLLNVSRLGQRLRLDFSDISGKGIAFDGIQGHLQFSQGRLSTQDLILQSSVMLAGIRGDVDLHQQTFNQTLSVIPDVKSSLPVVSALFGGLGLGAAVALLDRLTDQQDKQAQLDDETVAMRYKITGAWDEPRIEAIKSTTMDDDLEDLWE